VIFWWFWKFGRAFAGCPKGDPEQGGLRWCKAAAGFCLWSGVGLVMADASRKRRRAERKRNGIGGAAGPKGLHGRVAAEPPQSPVFCGAKNAPNYG
jgi:hypothetical protein